MSPTKAKRNASAFPPLIVGIGASAGGVEALQAMLGALPSETAMAFVVVMHVESSANEPLSEIISKFTHIPVSEAENGTAIEPGHIYTLPRPSNVSIHQGKFEISPARDEEECRNPVDKLLQSLAEDQGERAVAVLLSGHGSDGACGLKAVSKAGGMTLVQDPGAAKNNEMPLSAIQTGSVDHVLASEALAEELLAYSQHMSHSGEKDEFEKLHSEVNQLLPRICEVLLRVTGHNFRHYKSSTLGRRIQRRIQVLRLTSASDYLKRLHQDNMEVHHLFNDLLIGVTAFFRDPEAFDALAREVFPRLLKDRKSDEPLRIWVAGCATGEEAYTIAMLVKEQLSGVEHPPEVQIFATDLDEEALVTARQGIYPFSIANEITPDRLKRFFVKKGQHYHVSRDIRMLVLFSLHNLINDPLFPKSILFPAATCLFTWARTCRKN